MSNFLKHQILSTLCVGLLVGGLLATILCVLWLTLGPVTKDPAAISQAPPAEVTRPPLVKLGSTDFDKLSESVSNFELTASLYSLLGSKGEKDLLRLLNQSSSIDTETVRHIVQSVVFERLVDVDPNIALHHAMELQGQQRIESLEVVFQEWAVLDLDAAIFAGINLDYPFTKVALRTVVLARSDLSEKMRHDIELHLGDSNFIHKVLAKQRTWLQTQNPEEAWYDAIGDGKLLTNKVGLLASIAEVWWRQDSDGILQKIVESTTPTSHHWTSETYVVLRLLAQALAEYAPQDIFEQAVNLAEPYREALMHAVSEHWSRFDPHAALLAVSNHELNARRKILTRAVAQVWARSNPHELIQISNSFAQPLQAIAMEEAIFSLGRTNRDESTNLLQDAHNKGIIAMSSLDTYFSDWVKEDRRAAIQWILSNQELKEHEREKILKVIFESIVQGDYQQGVTAWNRLADSLFQSVKEYEAELVRVLAKIDIEVAISVLPSVRKESKLTLISAVGGALVYNDQPMRALELADLLLEDQRSVYYTNIFLQWSRYKPDQLMDSIRSLATNKLKNLAAKTLTQTHSNNPILSSKELDYVKTYLD